MKKSRAKHNRQKHSQSEHEAIQMTLILGSSIMDLQKYSEDVPERNEGIMSAVQTRAMAKQHMQRPKDQHPPGAHREEQEGM